MNKGSFISVFANEAPFCSVGVGDCYSLGRHGSKVNSLSRAVGRGLGWLAQNKTSNVYCLVEQRAGSSHSA